MGKFSLEDYLSSTQYGFSRDINGKGRPDSNFEEICREVKGRIQRDWDSNKDELNMSLNIQKKAIIGHTNEVEYLLVKIREILGEMGCRDMWFPSWYQSAEAAVYHENWGLAGLAEWFSPEFEKSSSAKIIGDRIYFLEKGRMVLKPQRISDDRRDQLLRAFLLLTPEARLDRDFHELYMLDGTRVTIFRGGMTKKGQDVFVFRRYIIPTYSFEEQVSRGTIPVNAVPLFKLMIALGYNVAFTGAVRSAKTTFLTTWQSYEDPALEGVMVETDPEIPLHVLMPTAPNIQLIADNEKLEKIVKNLLRSDADYFIMAEARDGIALDIAVRAATKGTRRMKITFHERDPYRFPYDVAAEIVQYNGGNEKSVASKVAASFDYIFHFVQLKRKDQKRLRGIYEMYTDGADGKIIINQICRYDFKNDSWEWFYHMAPPLRDAGEEEDSGIFMEFDRCLRNLAGVTDSAGGAA